MKNRVFVLCSMLWLWSACTSTQSIAERAESAQRMRAKIESTQFVFEPNTAQSLRFNTVHLSPDYSLAVTKDSLTAYLPYYGQAYTAPLSSTEGGIRFVSTDFERSIVPGKRVGQWHLSFKTLDTRNPIQLHLDVWDNGTAHLVVIDPDRQAIAFDGYLK